MNDNMKGIGNQMKTLAVFALTSLTLLLGAVEPDLPQYLKDEAVIWLDANVNLVQDAEGGIVEWRDVRETDLSATPHYLRALAYLPNPATDYSAVPPMLYDDVENRFNGKKLVDFGEYFSGKWLYFAKPDNVITQLPVCAFAGMVGFHGKSYGMLFGDISSFMGRGGKEFFGKSTDSTPDSYIAKAGMTLCRGETRIDGEIIDPSKTKYGAFQVFSQNGPRFHDDSGIYVHPCASTLFNDRNHKVVNGAQDRQGGGIIGELLVFGRTLSAAERRAVDEYLSCKWFGKTCSGKDASISESLTRIDPTAIAEETVYATNEVIMLSPASSAGVPVADALLSASQNLAEDFGNVTVSYDVGSPSVNATTKHFQVPQNGIYGVSMTVARDTKGEEADAKLVAEFTIDNSTTYYHVVQDDPRGDRDAPKTYTFTLPYLIAGDHTLRFSMRRAVSEAYRAYTASDITIVPVKSGEFVPVKDAGFDSTMVKIWQAANAWYARKPNDGSPWTFEGSSNCGITLYSSYWWWEAGFNGETLADMRRCFLAKGDSVSQTLNVPRSGRVRLSFRYANRGNSGSASSTTVRPVGHRLSVSVGDAEVAFVYPKTQQNRTCSTEFDISEGEQVLKISVDPSVEIGDCVAIVDDVMIEYVDGIAPSSIGSYAVAAESDGWYRLSVEAAGPVVDRNSVTNCLVDNAAYSPVVATVAVDGVTVGTMTAKSDSFFSYAITLPRLKAGAHNATLSNSGPLSMRVRDISLVAVAESELSVLNESSVAKTTFVVSHPGQLYLDFIGTLGGCYLKVEGKKVSGVHSAVTDRVRFVGEGAVDGAVRGLVIGIR